MSDLHLGAKACNADLIINVLKHFDMDYIILNGDVIDFWQLSISSNWSDKHTEVIRALFKKAKQGVKIIITIGNHDEVLREYAPLHFGSTITITDRYTYKSISHGEILFVHGDIFDFVIRSHKWLARIGSVLYDGLVYVNHYYNKLRKMFGLDYWSLSKYLKEQTKKKIGILSKFDSFVVDYAKKKGFATVSAGHIHIPEYKTIDDILYINTGDMCETGSFVIEHMSGKINLVKNFNKFVKRHE